MSRIDLAKRLYKVVNDYDHFDALDNDYTIESASEDIQKHPEYIIEYLLDIIDGQEGSKNEY